MNFIEAIKKLQEGYKLTRELWLNEYSSRLDYISYNHIDCSYTDQLGDKYRFYNVDYLANDWKILPLLLYTFEDAIKAYKSGKSIKRKGYSMIHDEYICDLDRDDILANDWEILP